MTSYFEFNEKTATYEVIEPDDTLCDTGVHLEHGGYDSEEWEKLNAAYQEAIRSQS